MNIRGFGVLTLLCLCVAGLVSTGAKEFLVIAMLLAVLLCAAFIMAFMLRPVCRLQGNTRQVRGQTEQASVVIRNPYAIPMINTQIDIGLFKDAAEPLLLLAQTCDIAPRGEVTFPLEITCMHRGEYRVEVDYLRRTDIFGLFSLPAAGVKPLRLLSLPVLCTDLPADTYAAMREVDEGQMWRKSALGEIQAESRAYQHGDTLHAIHWKQSARRHKYFTRVREQPTEPTCAVLIDTQMQGVDELAYEDAICECAYSLVYAQLCLRRHVMLLPCNFTLSSPGMLPAAAEMLSLMPFDASMNIQALGEMLVNRKIPDMLFYISSREESACEKRLLTQLSLMGCSVARFCPSAYFSEALQREGFSPVTLQCLEAHNLEAHNAKKADYA